MSTREDSKSASVSEGLGCSSIVCFCTEIRSAFCIVPGQARGIFGQVPLACACPSLACLLCCLRSCAHPSQLRSCLSLHSRTISLTTARSPSRHSLSTSPSSSLLPSVYFSQCTFTFKHASFYCSGIFGQEASRTLTSFIFHPPTFPLVLPICSVDRIGTSL